MLTAKKAKFRKLFDICVWPFEKIGLSANQLTILTLLFAGLFFYLMLLGNYWLALASIIVSISVDALDGHLARRKNTASKYGAYLDTIADRYIEFIIFLYAVHQPS